MNEERQLRVLVAGGAGFIGSHLCEALAAAGAEVHVVDNLCTGAADNLPRGVTLHRADVAELPVAAATGLFGEGLRFDQIYNLACPASPVHYQREPLATWKASVLGTLRLLELAEAHGARFLQASTSEIYGSALEHPQKESLWTHLNPVGVRSCYDLGKAAAETLVTDYGRLRGVNARIVRIFNVYGPRMALDDGRAVANFVAQAVRGEPLTVYGDGRQTRAFCYVEDMVRGLLAAMACDSLPGPCNLGCPVETSIRALARQVSQLVLGSLSQAATGDRKEEEEKERPCERWVYRELPSDDPERRCPDIGLARRLLGWEPRVALREGLTRTIADLRRRLLPLQPSASALAASPSA